MVLNHIDVAKRLKRAGLLDCLAKSSVNKRNAFSIIISVLNVGLGKAVEIGTYKGITAGVLASVFDEVYTFDIVRRPITGSVWKALEVEKKIKYFVFGNKVDLEGKEFNDWIDKVNREGRVREFIADKLKDIDFDFAYIDAKHDKNVRSDFKLVENCKYVLFDDYFYPGVKKFMNEIGAFQIDRFGLYENKKATKKFME